MFSWGSFLLTLTKLLSSLANWLRETQLIKMGETKATEAALEAETIIIAKASEAREDARADNVHTPSTDSLPDDGFRRD
jgi:hypothetical protein